MYERWNCFSDVTWSHVTPAFGRQIATTASVRGGAVERRVGFPCQSLCSAILIRARARGANAPSLTDARHSPFGEKRTAFTVFVCP